MTAPSPRRSCNFLYRPGHRLWRRFLRLLCFGLRNNSLGLDCIGWHRIRRLSGGICGRLELAWFLDFVCPRRRFGERSRITRFCQRFGAGRGLLFRLRGRIVTHWLGSVWVR